MTVKVTSGRTGSTIFRLAMVNMLILRRSLGTPGLVSPPPPRAKILRAGLRAVYATLLSVVCRLSVTSWYRFATAQ